MSNSHNKKASTRDGTGSKKMSDRHSNNDGGEASLVFGYGGRSSHKQGRLPEGAGYLNKTPVAIRPLLKTAKYLDKFCGTAGALSLDERRQIVAQALILLEQTYVHLPLKKAIHAVDPVQRLKLLRFQLAEMTQDKMPSEHQFHDEMLKIFTSVRDFHTSYFLPAPFNSHTAFLPFIIEEFFDRAGERKRRFLVSHVLKEFPQRQFRRGVEILFWNGVPIERAIELNGENQSGSNPDARFACGLDAMTIRPMASSLPPDEDLVTITYRSLKGAIMELKQKWLVIPANTLDAELRSATGAQKLYTKLSINLKKNSINQVRKVLFAPKAIEAQNKIEDGKIQDFDVTQVNGIARGRGTGHARKRDGLNTSMPTIFGPRRVETKYGTFAYVRIRTFDPLKGDVRAFVAEFQKLLELLPQKGLIIDIRNNPGGDINAGERLLQLLTPGKIEPETFAFINTPLNLSICRAALKDLQPWVGSIAQSVLTGATHSAGFPLTTKQECNDIGQTYFGPVVLITDALCYSTSDIFAAGFQDHSIGVVLGTDSSTGAGGANVWSHQGLLELMSGQQDNPFEQLPGEVNLRVAIRRSQRVGEGAGTPLEEFGVVPNVLHKMSKADLLEDNIDLINHAAALLSRLSARVVTNVDGKLTLEVRTKGISRLAVLVDGEPQKSLDLQDEKAQFMLDVLLPHEQPILQLRGFNENCLVAVCNIGPNSNSEHSSMRGASQMVASKSNASGSKSGPGATESNKKTKAASDKDGAKSGAGDTSSNKGVTPGNTSKKPSKKK